MIRSASNHPERGETVMGMTIAFDVCGTLVNPLAMANHLELQVANLAVRFAELWRPP